MKDIPTHILQIQLQAIKIDLNANYPRTHTEAQEQLSSAVRKVREIRDELNSRNAENVVAKPSEV